ncbi:MAG: phytanoyl-CoA dioxygenase family protein, partial [Proteobacteria bacterium]|nr:phytanoyl-CoA dioxygenase family protein [Pseudomonadota bacterium]
ILSESGIVFVRRSHLWEGGLRALFDRASERKRHEDSKSERASDTHPRRGKPELLSWDVEPGDCLVWQNRTLHKGRGNQSIEIHRRAVGNDWFGDDATYSVRDPQMDPSDAYFGLRHGEPMRNSKACPLVWPRGD